jgi:hypothetical protein
LDQALQTQFINNVCNAQVKDEIAEGFPTLQALLERAIQAELAFEPQQHQATVAGG